jgi:hypothetical protein
MTRGFHPRPRPLSPRAWVGEAFKLTTGKYWIFDTNVGGRYKEIDPDAEIKAVSDSDIQYKGNTRHLIRMMKIAGGVVTRVGELPSKGPLLRRYAMMYNGNTTLRTW